MAINNRSLSAVQGDVTSAQTREGDFRDGLDDTLRQLDDNQQLLNIVRTSGAIGDPVSDPLTKLAGISATAVEINRLTEFTGDGSDLNASTRLTDAGAGTANYLLQTSGANPPVYTWVAPFSYAWTLGDGDTTDLTIANGYNVQFTEGGGVNINWVDTSDSEVTIDFAINTGITANNGLSGGGILNANRTIGIADGGITAPKLVGSTSAVQVISDQDNGNYTINSNTMYAYIEYIGDTTLTISAGTREGQVINVTSNSSTQGAVAWTSGVGISLGVDARISSGVWTGSNWYFSETVAP